MSTINQMWEKFAQHQPKADERGYGAEWKRMCEERTSNAAWSAAADAARDAAWAAWRAAASAANAAWAAEAAAAEAAAAERLAAQAIDCIAKAEGRS